MIHDRWPSVGTLTDFDRLFEGLFHRAGTPRPTASHPRLNVHENSDEVIVRALLPGFDPSSLRVQVEDDVLVIAGDRPAAEGARAVHRERWTGTFRREVALGTHVDVDRVEARYDDGILSVRLPKAAAKKPRFVEIHTN